MRSDLVESLRRLHDAAPDDAVSGLLQEITAAEPEEEYRKYAKLWR